MIEDASEESQGTLPGTAQQEPPAATGVAAPPVPPAAPVAVRPGSAHAQRLAKFEQMLGAAQPVIQRLLPRHETLERVMAVAITARSRNPELMECTDLSILRGIILGAQTGLDVSGVTGEAYLVPRWNKNTREKEATFVSGWRGLVKLARQSGRISAILAREIYDGEPFEYEDGLVQILRHRPIMEGLATDAKIIGAWALAVWDNGFRQVEVMNRTQLDKVRASSDAWRAGAGPWVTHQAEMDKKSVIRRIAKKLPQSYELARVLAYEDAIEVNKPEPVDPDLPTAQELALELRHALPESVVETEQPPAKTRTEQVKRKIQQQRRGGNARGGRQAEREPGQEG